MCKYPISDIHHIVPKRFGGTDIDENLIELCPNHHRAFHKLLSGMLYYQNKSFYANTAACLKEDIDLEIIFDFLLKNEKELYDFFAQHSDQIFDAVNEYYDNK